MQRTKKTRGAKPFQMRSGNTTPYPFLGKALKTIGGGAVGAIKNMLPGSKGKGGVGEANDMNTKIDEIHAALVGDEGGDTMMTKKTHMYHTVDAHGQEHGHKGPGYPTSYTETVTKGPFPEKPEKNK